MSGSKCCGGGQSSRCTTCNSWYQRIQIWTKNVIVFSIKLYVLKMMRRKLKWITSWLIIFRQFGEIYDVETFVRSLKGVVEVDKNPPAELSNVVSIPDGVSENFIASKIKPIFDTRPNLKIVTRYNSSKGKLLLDESSIAYQCIALFESLKLQADLQQLVDSMVATLRSLSHKIRSRYIAVDLRVDDTFCQARRRCYNAQEIGEFLRNIGVERETSIYLTQTGWSSSLSKFRDVFPNTFTKVTYQFCGGFHFLR